MIIWHFYLETSLSLLVSKTVHFKPISTIIDLQQNIQEKNTVLYVHVHCVCKLMFFHTLHATVAICQYKKKSHLLRWKYYPANGFFCLASTSSYRRQLSYNLRFYHPDYWYVLMCSNSSLLLTWILRTHISFLIHTVNSLSVWLKLRCWTRPRSLPTGIPLLWSLAMEQDINN